MCAIRFESVCHAGESLDFEPEIFSAGAPFFLYDFQVLARLAQRRRVGTTMPKSWATGMADEIRAGQ